jgi:phage major head subunit gpT-like protein
MKQKNRPATIKASKVESRRCDLEAEFRLAAAGDATATPTFELVAYTGRAIRQSWSRNPLVVDLAGMDTSRQNIPILWGHDATIDSVLGQSSAIKSDGQQLIVAGELIGDGDTAQKVLSLARRGMRFQASIGADTGRIENISPGEVVTVNGREFSGPLSIVRGSSLREVSIVLMGADAQTSAAIAAEASEDLTMAHDANTTPTDKVEAAAAGAADPKTITESLNVTARGHDGDALVEKTAKLEEAVKAAQAQAVELGKRLELAEIRAARPAIHVASEPANEQQVVEAALCLQAGLPAPEKHFNERTLEAANKARRTTSLGEVLVRAAKGNGYTGSERISTGTLQPILQAAFATHAISQLLEAAVNKFLLSGFNAVEQVWQEISAVRSVGDFKAINMYRLNGSFKFQKVGNSGELKVAAGSDTKRSVSAETYGITTQLTRQDIVNDDLNALSLIPQRIGRGAALSLNDVIWGEFLSSNSSYYQAASAGSGNALSFDSLSTATTAFRKLNDPDGNPLGIAPKILLVPPELELTASRLMTTSALIASSLGSTSSKVVEPAANVLAGRYRVVVSNYLTSSSTWWLMADAADLNALDVVFLNGQQVPTIEQVQADYSTLGVQMRGYMDFGVTKAESLSCYRMATS